MLESAAALVEEHRALEEAMADPAVAGDPDRLRETNKRYSALAPTVAAYHAWKSAQGDDPRGQGGGGRRGERALCR